jgi:hypothetical protein
VAPAERGRPVPIFVLKAPSLYLALPIELQSFTKHHGDADES